MKNKITNEQIDRAMESGAQGASEYFTACGAWIKANWENLVELHKTFESETNSTIDQSVFCSRIFNETQDGQAAAEKHLRPILNLRRN